VEQPRGDHADGARGVERRGWCHWRDRRLIQIIGRGGA
jgi:hypothetical protein